MSDHMGNTEHSQLALEGEVARLLSALEEAQREANAQNAWWNREIERHNGTKADLAAAESRADALQAELNRLKQDTTMVGESAQHFKDRADALQAEVERLRKEADDLHHNMTLYADERNEERARADAAWRAALEAAAVHVENYEGDFLARTDNIVEEIRALPPPSATAAPAEEDPARCRLQGGDGDSCAACNNIGTHAPAEEASFPGVVAAGLLAPGQAQAPPAEEEKCPECEGTGKCACGAESCGRCWTCGGTGRAPSRGEVG